MKCNLVLQSFGRENEYKRAILTILSYQAHTSLPAAQTNVLLFTDKPDYFYPYLQGLTVDYILLTPEKIKDMRGAIDFLHRMKIALIDEALASTAGPLLYADSDTFFTADPTPILQQLAPEKSFMHLWEYQFESLRHFPLPGGKTFRDFLSLIESQTFRLADGTPITISPQDVSWNAGVMLFHPAHRRFIPDVYALTDQFYPPTLNHASEQYAFSILLQKNTELASCQAIAYHYWYRVKKQITDVFLDKWLTRQWAEVSLSEKIVSVKKWTQALPGYYKRHQWTLEDNAIQAFNTNRYWQGYKWAAQALVKQPFGTGLFLKSTLYHLWRHIKSNGAKEDMGF